MESKVPEASGPAPLTPEEKEPNVFDEMVEASQLRRSTATFRKRKILVREPSGLEHVDYISQGKTDKPAALASLFHSCVINEDGTPAMTRAQADAIARGNSAVFVPLLNAILGFSTPQKKT